MNYSDLSELERKFHLAMVSIYERAKRECNYNATRFLQMISENGGLATARTLTMSNTPSDGFTALWESRRLDLTVEAHLLKKEFTALFSDEERAVARQRLADYGFLPPNS